MPDGSPCASWAATVRALLCSRRRRADAGRRRARRSPGCPATSPWRPVALVLRGIARAARRRHRRGGGHARGRPQRRPSASGATWAGVVARSERALLALGARTTSPQRSRSSPWPSAFVDDVAVDGLRRHRAPAGGDREAGDRARATARRRARRSRRRSASARMLTHACPLVRGAVRGSSSRRRISRLSDASGAATLYREADDILRRRPRLGTLVDAGARTCAQPL